MTENNPLANSIGFVSSLHKILNLLDTITDLLPEGIYLQICNELKIANSNVSKLTAQETIIRYIEIERQRISRNPIMIHHIKMSGQQIKERRKLEDSAKLKDGWKLCDVCNRLVKNMWRHQNRTQVCHRIKDVKEVVVLKKEFYIENFIILDHTISDLYSKWIHRGKRQYYKKEKFADKCWSVYFGEENYKYIVG